MTDPTTLKLVDNIGAARGTGYFLMKEQLTKEEVAILEKVHKFGETEVLPVVNPYWERGEFPFDLVPKIVALNIVSNTMKGYSPFDPMYGPAVCCKRFRRSGRYGLASMYPASGWSALCSGPSWISARMRSD
jgi:hypothetical protein